MVISQYDYRMYQDEIGELRQQMAQFLLSMELYHQGHTQAEFDAWWSGEGRDRRYFDMKGRLEKLQAFLARARVEEAAQPKMRHGRQTMQRRRM